MALPLKLNFSDYDKFLTDPDYTTSAEAQDYFRNMDMLVEALIDVGLWQPETNYPNGHVVFSPNMPNGTEAVCVATNGGKSSNTEPSWGEVGGDNVSDGTCFWKLRWKHWSKSVASVDDMLNGTSNDKVVTPYLATLGQTATNRLPNATYKIDDVVYHKSNLSVALKCATAGTTSNTELDISTVSVGESVEDGTCVWSVVGRISDSVPIGTIFAFGANEHPIGYLACDGTAVSRIVYADLFAVIGTTYGAGDGSTTFNLPNLNNNSFLEGSNTAFGGSATVQPKSVTVKFCIKAYGAITNAGSVELENAMKAFENLQSELDKEAGFIKPYAGDVVPSGYLPCNGSELSRSTYARLFSIIGTTYGAGDGSTTFNLPNLNNNSFLEGSNTAGSVKSAGLPNITGSIKAGMSLEGATGTGALSGIFDNSRRKEWHDGYNTLGNGFTLDASLSNNIYGASTTVQPKSVTVKFCIKY